MAGGPRLEPLIVIYGISFGPRALRIAVGAAAGCKQALQLPRLHPRWMSSFTRSATFYMLEVLPAALAQACTYRPLHRPHPLPPATGQEVSRMSDPVCHIRQVILAEHFRRLCASVLKPSPRHSYQLRADGRSLEPAAHAPRCSRQAP